LKPEHKINIVRKENEKTIKTHTVGMQTQLVGYEFKKKGLPTDKHIAVENSKVSNDYFWKTNEYTDKEEMCPFMIKNDVYVILSEIKIR
jgi:hypothetical protein